MNDLAVYLAVRGALTVVFTLAVKGLCVVEHWPVAWWLAAIIGACIAFGGWAVVNFAIDAATG